MKYYSSWQFWIFCIVALAIAVSAGYGDSVGHGQRVFSAASIRGSYGISYVVALVNPSGATQLLSGTGVVQADGAGHLIGEETTNTNGEVCSGSMAGTYSVEPNGTGTATLTFTPTTPGCAGLTFQQSLVIMESGRIVRVADMIPSEVTVFEEWRKQI
jgi:hypothetical protein